MVMLRLLKKLEARTEAILVNATPMKIYHPVELRRSTLPTPVSRASPTRGWCVHPAFVCAANTRKERKSATRARSR
jgi:hypothetical protein